MFLKLLISVVLSAQFTICNSAGGISYFHGIERIDLNADKSTATWIASGTNDTGIEIKVPATVPGGIYSDLEDHGILGSPIYHEYNDMENRWVGRMNWTYSRNFHVSRALLSKIDVSLVCEGLDTISTVYVNDVLIGQSENMFVRYVFDIKSALRAGRNTLTVAFMSPVEYANKKYLEHERLYGYPVVPESLVPEYRGENQAQMIRKMQSSFSWDWGPSYPNSGIWKNIYIEGYSGAIIRDVMLFSQPSKNPPDESASTQWGLTARVYYDAASNVQDAIIGFNRIDSAGVSYRTSLERGKGNSIDIQLVQSGSTTKLWWPNGYGQQILYWYNISLSTVRKSESSSKLLRYGFRTVDLIEDFVDEENTERGREFYFLVNGVKMYSKGSNAIPLHVLPERITKEQTSWLLRSAKMSYQNMIRVWGGGVYESDIFFDLADEFGIFIWQDFMFACAMYPATEEFRANVRREVETQVKRLQYRTSLAMWAGNNENEAALRDNWYGTGRNFSAYKQDYIKLYINTIKPLTEQLDPSRKFLSSSPTNGKKTEEDGWIAKNPYDLKYGDIHFYNYYDDNWNWKTFRRTRYASEYGYQSYPHYETLAEVADNISTWTWNGHRMDHRQHHPRGQLEICGLIKTHFPFPRNYNSREAFPYMLYMAQLSQSMGQKIQTEFYRRLQDPRSLDLEGTGNNMGALYWQLNDIWQGASWASIEINGRWKLQMYFALKFFSQVLPSPYKADNGDVVIELISDLPSTTVSELLLVQIFKLSSLTPVYERQRVVSASFLTSPEVYRIQKSELERLGCTEEADSGTTNPCVVYVTSPGLPDNFLFLQYPKNKLSLRNPHHSIEGIRAAGDGKTIYFRLTTEAVAPFVYLTVASDHRGYFSDNGFLQVSTMQMSYYSENGITLQEFKNNIKVMSLYNVTVVAEDYPTPSRSVSSPRRRQFASYFVNDESTSSSSEGWLTASSVENNIHLSRLLKRLH